MFYILKGLSCFGFVKRVKPNCLKRIVLGFTVLFSIGEKARVTENGAILLCSSSLSSHALMPATNATVPFSPSNGLFRWHLQGLNSVFLAFRVFIISLILSFDWVFDLCVCFCYFDMYVKDIRRLPFGDGGGI